MKKIYLVHCWGGKIEHGWYPWIKKQLKNSNVEVILTNMPDTENPNISKWISKLDSVVDVLDEETYFIGHSIGCQAILRYLETKNITRIGGIFFVAPWLDLIKENLEDGSGKIAEPWINTSIDLNKVKQFTDSIVCIFSSNDYFVSLEQEKEFRNKLNAKTIIMENKGHISAEDGINELPVLLHEIGKILGFELVEIVDSAGSFTGDIMDKELVHDKNLFHKEVGLFIINSNNQILLEKRNANKRYNPNKWGLCAGHVDAYEDNETALLRELEEELGVVAGKKDIIYFNTMVKKRESNAAVIHYYYMFLDKDEKDFVIQEEELSEVKWTDFKQYKNKVINNDLSITFTNSKDDIDTIEMLEKVMKDRNN